MAERITIMIGDDNLKLLRKLQSKIIARTTSTCSFSKTINIVLEYGINPDSLDKKLKYLIKDI